ncbi:hypothetical protein WN51_04898 [Melipona quadrifasciata]|uniref:Uncharacterized protein n=1 Tax=Melipona quadrifasciata TaxID=166423 RepID=A0A0N1IT89_9HYME|nr:hypothetical protein WN51_04898 [Melipona quadrifasciata]
MDERTPCLEVVSNKPSNKQVEQVTVLQMIVKKIPWPTSLITAFKRSSTTYVTRPLKVTEDDHHVRKRS